MGEILKLAFANTVAAKANTIDKTLKYFESDKDRLVRLTNNLSQIANTYLH